MGSPEPNRPQSPPPAAAPTGSAPPATSLASRGAARLIVALRWLLVPGWIALAVLATSYLPSLSQAEGGPLGDMIPANSPAYRVERESYALFKIPLLARVAVVQRDPHGLPMDAQVRVFQRAAQLDLHPTPAYPGLAGALPITNTLGLFPSSKERGTTGITFLFFRAGDLFQQTDVAGRWTAQQVNRPDDHVIGVTGPIPARAAQSNLIGGALLLVELATVLLVALIMAVTFRAVLAPVVTLAAAGIAYALSLRVIGWAGSVMHVSVPSELEPVLVVLLLGIVTDYSIFFLTGYRDRLATGDRRVPGARKNAAEFLPIIVTAGLTVAAGTAALAVAHLKILRAFGPGLAITVLISLLVAITFVPSALALLGRAAYWPSVGRGIPITAPGRRPEEHVRRSFRMRAARLTARRAVAFFVAVLSVAVLVAAASGLRFLRLGFSLTGDLPPGVRAHEAAVAAGRGFAPGILSPTMILVQAPGLSRRHGALASLEELVGRQPGVAGVLGPREAQALSAALGSKAHGFRPESVFVSPDGSAARILAILRAEPLGGVALGDLKALEVRMPALLARAGLSGARVGYAGDTALVQDTVGTTTSDVGRIALAILLVDFVLLVIFLRAVLAPLYLLAASVLAVGSALGLTVYVFQVLLRRPDLTYYVPFAVAVLLVSLGADYNIFIVGRIWEEARRRPLRQAVAIGAGRASRAITVAGITLAFTFAILGVVRLWPFWEFAFAMFAGILIDSFVVRSLLVPALVSLFGGASWWPFRRPPLEAPPVEPRRLAA